MTPHRSCHGGMYRLTTCPSGHPNPLATSGSISMVSIAFFPSPTWWKGKEEADDNPDQPRYACLHAVVDVCDWAVRWIIKD